MKFTDEELSRIIGAHESGQLVSYLDEPRCFDANTCCAIQAARMCNASEARDIGPDFYFLFDREYKTDWSADELLAWLEAQGAA